MSTGQGADFPLIPAKAGTQAELANSAANHTNLHLNRHGRAWKPAPGGSRSGATPGATQKHWAPKQTREGLRLWVPGTRPGMTIKGEGLRSFVWFVVQFGRNPSRG
jgi:hypothetical protein